MDFIHRNCPICGNTCESRVLVDSNFDPSGIDDYAFASRKIPEYMHYRLLRCNTCDLVYTSPAPSNDALVEAYTEAAFDSSEEAHYASMTYARFLGSIMREIPDLDSALDIGAGDGAFLEQLKAKGFHNVQGVEPSVAPIKAAKPEIGRLIKNYFFDPKDFETNSFSLVTCFQTLEHLHEPTEMTKGIYSLLKRGGAALFICHNYNSISRRVLGFRSPIFDIEHLQLFSRFSAVKLLKQSGFQEVEVHLVVNRYPVHYWAKLFPFPKSIKEKYLTVLKRSGLGRVNLSIPAGNIAVIGYKK